MNLQANHCNGVLLLAEPTSHNHCILPTEILRNILKQFFAEFCDDSCYLSLCDKMITCKNSVQLEAYICSTGPLGSLTGLKEHELNNAALGNKIHGLKNYPEM